MDDFDILSLLDDKPQSQPEQPIDYPREVICYTPLGNPLLVMAQNSEHEEWLILVNPKPQT